MAANSWPDAHKAHAIEKWRAGFSASQVSKSLHDTFKAHYSRNAVIGIMHRLGETARGGKLRQPASAPRRTYLKPSPPARPKALNGTPWTPAVIPNTPAPPTFVAPVGAWKPLPGCEPRPLAELKLGLCRWPVGPAEGAEQLFCCRAVGDREAKGMAALYCAEHHARAVSANDFRKTKDLVRSLRHAIR